MPGAAGIPSATIRLLGVSKSFRGGGVPTLVLRPTTVDLPADRRVAVLGSRRSGKSTLLDLLFGTVAPDRGRVCAPFPFSPVVNAGGFLHPQMTALENIRTIARMLGLDAEPLMLSVAALAGEGVHWQDPLRAHGAAHRKALEAAIATVLPFGCCLLDDVGQLPAALLARCIAAAGERGAGMIFTTANPGLARQMGEVVLVIADATLHPFGRADKAVRFFQRQDGQPA